MSKITLSNLPPPCPPLPPPPSNLPPSLCQQWTKKRKEEKKFRLRTGEINLVASSQSRNHTTRTSSTPSPISTTLKCMKPLPFPSLTNPPSPPTAPPPPISSSSTTRPLAKTSATTSVPPPPSPPATLLQSRTKSAGYAKVTTRL